jgi:hypothetical protein
LTSDGGYVSLFLSFDGKLILINSQKVEFIKLGIVNFSDRKAFMLRIDMAKHGKTTE